MYNRIEIYNKTNVEGPEEKHLRQKIQQVHPALEKQIHRLQVVEVFWISSPDQKWADAATEIFTDPLLQNLLVKPAEEDLNFSWAIEKSLLPGMTDNIGTTASEALSIVSKQDLNEFKVLSGQLILFYGSDLQKADIEQINKKIISNSYIHQSEVFDSKYSNFIVRFDAPVCEKKFQWKINTQLQTQIIAIRNLSDSELTQLSLTNLLSLNLSEMKAIQNYYSGLKRDPTDVELEVLAQTWSEHCKHKIFAAEVDYQQHPENTASIPKKINSLFKTMIAQTTERLPKPWLLSVFKDNAGIVAFDKETAVCIKVETHNSPSALDPFGGAITGIVGVNRDILGCGFGAKPIFNTNVFCVGPLDKDVSDYNGLIPPKQILEGVRSGVEHGGNQSGIPTVNGALYFDESYIGKPLVFCGSGGIMPIHIQDHHCADKKIQEGDLICMLGGRIGRDGIHGATFSSLEMTESIPASVVQLGDPITQKRMTDFLLEARDLDLYRCITDNGAGGLSSSVGELAQISNGAWLDITDAKTKMPGLKPFELVISESQERMTLAVDPNKRKQFEELAQQRNVECNFLGKFTGSGRLTVVYKNEPVADLDLKFLHGGVPKLQLKAVWPHTDCKSVTNTESIIEAQVFSTLVELLKSPQIKSKESTIRQYDHEVQGRSVVKSLQTSQGRSTPNDAAVIALDYKKEIGVVVSCGLQPRLSKVDPWLMAQAVVDETVRNLLCVGAEFSSTDSSKVLALVDNFCWPDPVEDVEKMAALVRTCAGLQEACLQLSAPLISGKDSMKNDYKSELKGQKVKISVLPTLLMTALGRIENYKNARTADFKNPGDVIYILGPQDRGLLESEWHCLQKIHVTTTGKGATNSQTLSVGQAHWDQALPLYNWLGDEKNSAKILSAHDVSDGGILVSIAESCFTKNLGVNFESSLPLQQSNFSFGEGLHQIIVSCAASHNLALEKEWSDKKIAFQKLGAVTDSGFLQWQNSVVATEDLYAAWSGDSL